MLSLRIRETRLGLRNSTTRIPFRYGRASLTSCPQAVLGVTIEVEGKLQEGFAGDCLPPSWFDKAPGKTFRQQLDEMLSTIALAQKIYAEEFSSVRRRSLFHGWLTALEAVQTETRRQQLPELLASFGSSLLERALLDGAARAAGMRFWDALQYNLFGIEPGAVHPSLNGLQVRDWLPAKPLEEVYVRHTVGLSDPLTAGEIAADERLDDGLPQALEEYVERCSLRYLKVKVSNQLEHDCGRLRAIAKLMERHRGGDYFVTLDGNELYTTGEEFIALVEAMRSDPALAQLWENILLIEQPFPRSVALDDRQTRGIRELAALKPVIIDESDGTLDAYPRAVQRGYRGVSSKSCKGPIKSLLNAGLTWRYNNEGRTAQYVMTGEDLCCVGILPVQSDLCLTAALGLRHVERNGHHYHRGLSYLPPAQQQAALTAHGDFYTEERGTVVPRLRDGKFQIGSLQCIGFGFDITPAWDAYESPEDWDFDSLALNGSS